MTFKPYHFNPIQGHVSFLYHPKILENLCFSVFSGYKKGTWAWDKLKFRFELKQKCYLFTPV